MKWMRLMCVGGWLAWLTAAASAGTPTWGVPAPGCSSCPPPVVGPWTPVNPNPTPSPNPNPNPNPSPETTPNPNPEPSPNAEPSTLPGEAFAQGSEAGTQASGSVAPAMFGDLIGVIGRRVVLLPRGATLGGNTATVVAAQPLHSSYKIMEGESPRPENRAYVTYTFYDNVDRLLPGIGSSNLNRETLGLEQTFGGGDSSVGLRLPFLQLTGSDVVQDNFVGDLSLIYKHAFINDPQTGDLLSAGLAVTLPTGQGLRIAGESTLNATMIQPFVGFNVGVNDFYVEGFSSVAVPTDMRDVSVMFNSLAVGYRLYRDDCGGGLVRAVQPQLEMHLNTPLNHRNPDSDPIFFADSLDLTGGVRVFFRRAEVGACVGTPVTGPKPYDVEGMANLTFHW